MSLKHFCLSTHASQLQRWQQAFPDGQIWPSLEELWSSLSGRAVVWVHADSQKGALDTLIGRLRTHQSVHRVVVISLTPSVQETAAVLASGATGYCHALATPELFCKISTVVSNGGFWIGDEFINRLAGQVSQQLADADVATEPAALEKLSSREKQVAMQVKTGASNKEIASNLNISERTVKAHLSSIFQKLEIRDRLQLSLTLSESSPAEHNSVTNTSSS